MVEVTNENLILTRYNKKVNGSCYLRVYNASDEIQTGEITIGERTFKLTLKPFQFQTYIWKQGELQIK